MEEHENYEELPPENPPKWKKPLIFVMGLFMVGLMISFIFVTFPVGDILAGYSESSSIKNNILEGDGVRLVFEGDTYKQLLQWYNDELSLEIVVCLKGSKEGSNYLINELYKPTTYAQAYNHVRFAPCEESVVLLHTHPHKRCIASETDINTLKDSQKINPDLLMAVMCEGDRISIYE